MNQIDFWQIIQTSLKESGKDQERQYQSVACQLRVLSPTDIIDFQRIYIEKIANARYRMLWGAAYLINGGCSEDGFVYFCAWLVSQGEQLYTQVLENPDNLASVVDPKCDNYEFEMLMGVGLDIYEELTSKKMPPNNIIWRDESNDEHWDFDNDIEVKHRLPKLAKLYI